MLRYVREKKIEKLIIWHTSDFEKKESFIQIDF